MKSLRIAAPILAFVVLASCGQSSATPRSTTPAPSVAPSAAPATTAPSAPLTPDRLLAQLRAPILEPFTASFTLTGGDMNGYVETVVQDSDLNVSVSVAGREPHGPDVVLHDGTLYVRDFDDPRFGYSVTKQWGVPSGEWFPYDEWRTIGAAATGIVTFPDGLEGEPATALNAPELRPHLARVPLSLYFNVQARPLLESCYTFATGAPAEHVENLGDGRWALTCETDLAVKSRFIVTLDPQGRLTELWDGTDATGEDENIASGRVKISYAGVAPINAPDTTWFATRKAAVKKALQQLSPS